MTDNTHYNPFGENYGKNANKVVGRRFSEKNEVGNFDKVAGHNDYQNGGYNPFGKRNLEEKKRADYTNRGYDGAFEAQGASRASNEEEEEEDEDEETERGHWQGKAEFVLSCLGYAVGLGNVWRFPYLVYKNGGGAFLLPYLLMLVLIGLPSFFMEMIVGQYSGAGPMHLWAICPLFTGIGLGMEIITFLSSISYNVVMAWSFYYLFASWQSPLPWQGCTHPYNTPNCYSRNEAKDCESLNNGSFYNSTVSHWWFNQTCYNSSTCETHQESLACNITYVNATRVTASQQYFRKRVLNESGSIDESGVLQWELVLVLLLAWVVCWLCTVKGIKSTGKVVYFTAIFPYVVLFILLIRGSTLPGSYHGILFYIYPQWHRLTDARVWIDAAGQVLFSLSVGMGGLMTFSSYNKFHNNIYRDTLLVVGLDAVTSIMAGFTIFAIVGHMAFKLDQNVESVINKGPGLAFIVYPEVVTYIPPPQLWSSLFFFMLITLGIDTQMASIETIMTAFVDFFPALRRYKPLVAGGICFTMFLLGFSMCLQSGEYWVELLSSYSAGWSLVLIASIEIIVFSWLYGAKRLMEDLKEMTGIELWHHWWILFKFISPVLVLAVLVFTFVNDTAPTYGNNIPYPTWAQILGWLMAWVSIAVIPIVAVYIVIKSYSQEEYQGLTFGRRILALLKPSSKWVPSNQKEKTPN